MTDKEDNKYTCAIVMTSYGDDPIVEFKTMYDPKVSKEALEELGYVPACVTFMDNIAVEAVLTAAVANVEEVDGEPDMEIHNGGTSVH